MNESASRILTLVFTDLVDSTALKTRSGDLVAGDLIEKHRQLVSDSAATGRIIDWAGDGCFLTFDTPSSGLLFALRLQHAHGVDAELPAVRIGIHMGEVNERSVPGEDNGVPRVEGLAVDLTARICGLANPGQILISAAVADSARQHLNTRDLPQPVVWRNHGAWSLKGFDEAMQIREAGLEGMAPLATPRANEKAAPASNASPDRPRRWIPLTATVTVLTLLAGLGWWWMPTRYDGHISALAINEPAKQSEDPEQIEGFSNRPAIAVLPFDNLSGDPEQEYFADGLAEDLITRLALFRSFPVIARNSSFTFKGRAVDIKAVSADLGVRYVVEGSVRKSGDRVRIAAQLIDASTGEHVWAETYDREITDVFDVQDEISSAIAASMVGDLQRVEQLRATHREPENLEAWGLYQRGVPLLYQFDEENHAKARHYLERSVALDPQFVPARAKLAEALVWSVVFGWSDTPERTLTEAVALARHAAYLDPREPGSHISLAFAASIGGDIDVAVDEARRAIELNPSEVLALQYAGLVFALAGEPPEESIALVERGMRPSPYDPLHFLFYDTLGVAYFCAGRFSDGVAAGERLIALRPNYTLGYIYAAMNAAELGDTTAAHHFVDQARDVQPGLTLQKTHTALGATAPEIHSRMSAALRRAGLE